MMNHNELLSLLESDGTMVVERLDNWAATQPDRVFLYYGEDDLTLTYGEFGRMTDAIAGNLAASGIAVGDRVSILTTNPYVSAALMFSTWKAGAIYCPVNYAFAGRLLSYQLNDTAPSMIVTDARLLPVLNAVADDLESDATLVVFVPPPGAHDHVSDVVDAHPRFATLPWEALLAPSARPDVTLDASDPANIVYTSGTTGPSKGVIQPHGWMAQYTFTLRVPLTTDDVIYSDLPMYHVGGAIANVARAAWVGCEVAMWDRFSPNEFWNRIASRQATVAILLDVMIPWLMQREPSAADRENTLNKVYLQPLPLHHAEVSRRFGFDFVSAGFGQSESGAPVAALIEETAAGEGTPAPYYRGLSHEEVIRAAHARGLTVLDGATVTRKGFMGLVSPLFEVTIRDDRDRQCAPGEPGELALRPRLAGLTMIEYLGKPEATVRAWRNLWLHTGDAAVQDEDGVFYFVDRLGDRIRVRGENLSSFQVEDLLNQHEGVQFSAVFSIRSEVGDEDDIVAFVIPAAGGALAEEDIHAHAAAVMPKYMRPRFVRVVDDMPRTATNKVEKYKLRAMILAERGDMG